MNILNNIINNFEKDHVLMFEKKCLVDNESIKVMVHLTHLNNVCTINISSYLDENLTSFAKPIIDSLNSHPTIGIYMIQGGFLNLLVSVWLEASLQREQIDDIIDVLTSELITTSSMIKWRKEENEGKQ